jgi:hypothetical protein
MTLLELSYVTIPRKLFHNTDLDKKAVPAAFLYVIVVQCGLMGEIQHTSSIPRA